MAFPFVTSVTFVCLTYASFASTILLPTAVGAHSCFVIRRERILTCYEPTPHCGGCVLLHRENGFRSGSLLSIVGAYGAHSCQESYLYPRAYSQEPMLLPIAVGAYSCFVTIASTWFDSDLLRAYSCFGKLASARACFPLLQVPSSYASHHYDFGRRAFPGSYGRTMRGIPCGELSTLFPFISHLIGRFVPCARFELYELGVFAEHSALFELY